ncbi:MAG: tetratricopeptide repeat protein [Planctomycetota bacterium]|jgi:tetratricopeptide (TPR) repeat protein
MRQGRINWNLIIVLFLAVVIAAITAVGLRKYHRGRRAEMGLSEGLAAYEKAQWQDAASFLGQYLVVNPTDIDILMKYAESNLSIQPFRWDSLKQAINAYRSVLRLEDNSLAAEKLIGIYFKYRMPGEAELIARRFAENDESGDFKQHLAVALMHQRKYDEAFQVLSELVKQHPEQILAYKLLGKIAEKRADLTPVLPHEWYDRAIRNNPESAIAYLYRCIYRTQKEQYKQATEDLEQAEKCDISDIETRLLLAAVWSRRDDNERAIEHLQAAQKIDPKNIGLWQLWAVVAGQMGDVEQFVQIAEDGLQAMGQENYNFMVIAADLYVQANRLDRAEECLAALKGVEAERSTILNLEGQIAYARNQWAVAIEKWQQAIQLGHTSESLYLNLSDTLDKINNRPAAIQTLRRYISQNGNAFRSHLRLSQIFAKDFNWDDALEQATAAIQLKPTSLEARTHYLRCRIGLLDKDKAIDAAVLKKSIQQLIDSTEAVPARFLMFQLALTEQDFEHAETVLNQIEQAYGQSLTLVTARTRLLMITGRHEQAVSLLEQTLVDYPDSNEIVQLLLMRYTQQKDFDKALELLDAAKAKDANAFTLRQYELWRAEVLALAGRNNDAIEAYRTMAEDNQSDIFARRQLLSVFDVTVENAPQLQQWIDDIKAAEGQEGWQWKYEQAHFWFADVNKENFERRYPDIVKLLNENINLNSEDQASRILLASCHERAGNIQLALSLYQDATPRQSRNLDFILAAVSAMYRAREFRQAQAILAQATQEGITDPRLEKYQLRDSLRVGRQDDAISILEKMVSESPDDIGTRLSLAMLKIRQGQLEQAKDEIQQILDANPDSAAATAAMAELYLNQNQPEKALQVSNDYIAAYDTLAGYVMRGQILWAISDKDGLRQTADTIVKKFTDNRSALLVATRFYDDVGKSDDAIAVIKKLLNTSPEAFAVRKQAALIFLNQPDEAYRQQGAELLDQALEQNPVDIQLRMKKADLLIRQKNAVAFEQAKGVLRQLVDEYPRQEEAWSMMTRIALIEAEPGKAMDIALQGLSYLPDSKTLKILRAQAQSARSPEMAVEMLEILQRDYSDDPSVILMLSKNYRKIDKLSLAITLLEKSMENPALENIVPLKSEYISARYAAGSKPRAITLYQELIRQTNSPQVLLSWVDVLGEHASPADIEMAYRQWTGLYADDSRKVLAAVLSKMIHIPHPGAIGTAEKMIESTINTNPESHVGYQAKATLLHISGKKIDAIPWYEKAIAINPDQVIAINNLAWILCTEKADYQKALEYAQIGLQIDPAYVDLIDTRGTIYMHLGEYEKAAADFATCETMYFPTNPNRTLSAFHHGQCLLKLGDKTQALIKLLKAQDMDTQTASLSDQQRQQLDAMIRQISQ